MSTSELQAIDKAVSSPESVITDLAAFNGQRCFKYSGSCVDLDDSQAMDKACGSGYTVVGWDDAGCGKKSCVSINHAHANNGEAHYISTAESPSVVHPTPRQKAATGAARIPANSALRRIAADNATPAR